MSVYGTVNDIAMSGAKPLYLAAGFILEEGFPLADLEKIVISMAAAARQTGTPIITSDTKVVERGKADGVFITTTGVGVVPFGVTISANRAHPGCVILLSGSIGDHGVAVMASRRKSAIWHATAFGFCAFTYFGVCYVGCCTDRCLLFTRSYPRWFGSSLE
ncbi:AIR synthase related protein [Methylomonas sp. AM2-LC]|uniref:AIR synthase related protein n=1 Tax=Methylomonas sp. AM2-LC TaxID=3153301 RepID=UPI0032663F57